MQDPLITLRNLLKDNWSLISPNSTSEIKFSTGWYDEDVLTPQITVTELYDDDEPFELGYGTIRIYAVYQIDAWVTVELDTGKGKGLAKDSIRKMQMEIRRIFKNNLTGLEGLRYVMSNQRGRRIDEPDAVPPRLRWSKDIQVIYDI